MSQQRQVKISQEAVSKMRVRKRDGSLEYVNPDKIIQFRLELAFAKDLLQGGVAGLSFTDMRQYLEYIVDRRLELLGIPPPYGQSRPPLSFMELQDIQELTNFFERNVSAYQLGIRQEELKFDEKF